MGVVQREIKNTQALQRYDEIEKRKEWFFECQLRGLHLEGFRDVVENDPQRDPAINEKWLEQISKPAASAPLGTTAKEQRRIYFHSDQPVWTKS